MVRCRNTKPFGFISHSAAIIDAMAPLQFLIQWGVKCIMYHKGMCAKNSTYMWHEQAIMEWAWHAISVMLAATVWKFVHLPHGLSNCNKTVLWPRRESNARYTKSLCLQTVKLIIKKVIAAIWSAQHRMHGAPWMGCELRIALYVYVVQTSNNRVSTICMWRKQAITEWAVLWSLVLLAAIV